MTSIQLIEKRNKLMHDGGQLLHAGETVTAETRTTFDRTMVEVDTLQSDIKRVQRTEMFEAEQRSSTRPPRAQPGD